MARTWNQLAPNDDVETDASGGRVLNVRWQKRAQGLAQRGVAACREAREYDRCDDAEQDRNLRQTAGPDRRSTIRQCIAGPSISVHRPDGATGRRSSGGLFPASTPPRRRSGKPAVRATAARAGGRTAASRPPLLHHRHEPAEQVAAVARARRGFRVVLHREHRPVLEPEAAIRAVEERDVRLLDAVGQASPCRRRSRGSSR